MFFARGDVSAEQLEMLYSYTVRKLKEIETAEYNDGFKV
jgi:hypothetical protein